MSQATLPGRYRNSNLFSGYYLDERVFGLDEWDCDEEAEQAFEELQALYEAEQGTLESYDEDPLRQHWIDEVLSILGYESLPETPILDARGSVDRALYDAADDRRAAAAMKSDGEYAGIYGQSLSVLEAKQWDADFTARFGEARSYRDASHQIKYYLEHTPESVSWGILTNGKKWRLYGTKDYETETYYEVDLVDLLESGSVEVFKYFYVFFRPAAFRESAGTTFLDRVWSESETAAQELGEDLQDNVFTALRVLGEGFVETNDLEIDPAEEERLGELKEHSLVLLYRLMFVLYAESRGLIDPDDPHAAEEYEENFSLDALRREVIDEVGERADEGEFEREFSSFSTGLWSRLEDLFALVDSGNDDLGIPAYNGGLFDEESHEFLAENEVSDRHLAEVVYRLSTTETDEGHVAADYADLDTRHLGTIYEGLLEHEFAVAPEAQAAVSGDGGQVWKPADEVSVAEAVETVEAGELYVVNDDGERKATGAYYTPDYVVTYIVEETVGPLLSEIEDDLDHLEPGTQEYVIAFWERVTDLKVLDPAMGSGHFLTKATGYLADAVMERVRELESGSLFDEELVRRTISRECIYGVDVNGMAVELAKLSMWLETLAADQPLAFLDHHLKSGNSLVGSDITEVLAEDGDADAITDDAEGMVQSSLFDYFDQVRRQALDHVMDRMGELLAIDNETLDDVHSMEALYDDIREDPLYEHLQAMATVHTAGEFGLDVPDDAIERMARAIEDDEAWAEIEATDWFPAARAMAGEEGFFHWELEFPAVFFDSDGERLASAGFDAVVGNPPYGDILSTSAKRYCRSQNLGFESERADVFTAFVSLPEAILQRDGRLGYIIPNTPLRGKQYEKFRETNSQRYSINTIADFDRNQIFSVEVYTMILLCENETQDEDYVSNYVNVSGGMGKSETIPFELTPAATDIWVPSNPLASKIKQNDDTVRLGDGTICTCHDAGIDYKVSGQGWDNRGEGVKISDLILYEGNPESEDDLRYVGGGEIRQYLISPENKWLRHNYESFVEGDIVIQVYPEYNESSQKIVTRQTADDIIAALDTDQLYTAKSVHTTLLQNNSYDIRYILAVLNSNLSNYVYESMSGEEGRTFAQVRIHELRSLPIRTIDFKKNEEQPSMAELKQEYESEILSDGSDFKLSKIDNNEIFHDRLVILSKEIEDKKRSRNNLNLDLLDYLGSYEDGPTLGERYQPASGLSESVLTDTEADSEFEKLRVTGAQIEQDGDRLRVLAEPYVKPTDPDEYETNSRGYATLDPVPAMEFVGLSEPEADLIAAFVPHAVDAADGFAGYRDNATATISPLDRLEGLTLPTLADVEGGIERYMDARERAAELDEQIERTDELIDEIVYELYGLTDDEIEIVEEAVGE
ncbi:Eco57I restriction-modification methylase domain-containing protein [Halococcus salifodinae]|uniref:site-specific DNA-methyltransferase (adenine-specific) n=1 Tax=Halococcus salifodinae DSM 8989 TaxID=1227456 RepID=M0N5P0_9EURY|nr:TaqI-like C-terminal specificity domain-containing protein [Halococcus salifodinae]EMA53191.1 putative restriction/modification enzyme [Halococcus salifodinae DSM 8989]